MKLGSSVILTTLSKTTKQISIFGLSILLARWLTLEDYGTYLHTQLIMNVAFWAFMVGIPHSIYYFLPKTDEKHKLIHCTVFMVMAIGVLVSCGVIAGSDALANLLNNPNVTSLAWIIGGITLFAVPASIFEPMMIAADRTSTFIKVDFFFNILFFFAVFIPVANGLSIHNILLWTLIFYGAQTIVMMTIIGRLWQHYKQQFSQKSRSDKPEAPTYSIKKQLSYSLPIGLSQGVFELAKYLDKVIISSFFNPAVYAVYTRGAMDIPILHTINNTLDNLLMPRFIKSLDESVEAMLQLWHKAIKLTAILIYPMMVFLIFSADLLIPAVYSEKYNASIPIFQLYTLNMLVRVTTYNVIVRAIGKTSIMTWVAVFTEATNLILTLFLVKSIGIMGAPIGTLASFAVMSFGYLIAISNHLKRPFRGIFPWFDLLKVLTAACLPLIIVIPFRTTFLNGTSLGFWSIIGITGVIYTTIYWMICRFLPIVSSNERSHIAQLLPKPLRCLVGNQHSSP